MSFLPTACSQAQVANRFRQAGFLASLPRPHLLVLILLALLVISLRPATLAGTDNNMLDASITRGAAGAVRVSEPEAQVSSDVQQLTQEMQAALEFSARRYRVSPHALTPIFLTAQQAASESRLDPLLIIAVIAVESSFNPLAESVVGAQGLMQVIPRFHAEKLPDNAGQLALFDPQTNVRVGAQVLQEYIRRHGEVMPGLQRYAGAFDDPAQGYANKVLAERERLEAATRKRVI